MTDDRTLRERIDEDPEDTESEAVEDKPAKPEDEADTGQVEDTED